MCRGGAQRKAGRGGLARGRVGEVERRRLWRVMRKGSMGMWFRNGWCGCCVCEVDRDSDLRHRREREKCVRDKWEVSGRQVSERWSDKSVSVFVYKAQQRALISSKYMASHKQQRPSIVCASIACQTSHRTLRPLTSRPLSAARTHTHPKLYKSPEGIKLSKT